MTRNKVSSPSRKGNGTGDAGKGEKPMTTPHSPGIFKFGGYEASSGGKTKKVPVDVKEKKAGSSDDEWEPFKMDDFEKVPPFDPNKAKVGPTPELWPVGSINPLDRYSPSHPAFRTSSSVYYANKKPKLAKKKISKQEKTEECYSQEKTDKVRSEHLTPAKQVEGDIEDMGEKFPKFKNKNHKPRPERSELDKQVPRFKEEKPEKKFYDTGFYTINEGYGTFHGTHKKDDIPEEEQPALWQVTQHFMQQEAGCTPSQVAEKNCKCDTPLPVKGTKGYEDS